MSGFVDAIADLFKSLTSSGGMATHPSVAIRAEELATKSVLIESYRQYQAKTRNWFFSPNSGLEGTAKRPSKFDTWADWDALGWRQKTVLANLAGAVSDNPSRTAATLSSLKVAFADWDPSWVAVFWAASDPSVRTNTCNIFLGDALFLDGKAQVDDGKYLSAEDVWDEDGDFEEIDRGTVARGDIAGWGGKHVEVVTRVDHVAKTFCSRGGYRPPIGGELCGASAAPSDTRSIEHTDVRFFRVVP